MTSLFDLHRPDKRVCKQCGEKITVGKTKVGRVVWPGGICFSCYKKNNPKKMKDWGG